MMKTFTPEVISLKGHPLLTEAWLQDRIAEDPSILGLGDLFLHDKERPQPSGGRLDLLLRDSDSNRRYEVEIQLGPTDPSHIIRTIEYWDAERRRHPHDEHCAVIVAEDITARFFNVISLFNGVLPLIAIKVQAIEVNGEIGLFFTKVLDEAPVAADDEDEPIYQPTDRAYWEAKGSPHTVELVDQLVDLVRDADPTVQAKYNKYYIGLSFNGLVNNVVSFKAKKAHVELRVKLPETSERTNQLDEAGLNLLTYDKRARQYRISLRSADFVAHRELIRELIDEAIDAQG